MIDVTFQTYNRLITRVYYVVIFFSAELSTCIKHIQQMNVVQSMKTQIVTVVVNVEVKYNISVLRLINAHSTLTSLSPPLGFELDPFIVVW